MIDDVTTARDGEAADSSAEVEVALLLEGYLSDLEAGRPVDPEALIAEHPGLAGPLRACLEVIGGPVGGPDESGERRGLPPRPRRESPTTFWGGDDGSPRVLLSEPPDDEPAPVLARPDLPIRAGRYQILGEIARGGMGAVLRARDTDLGRELALKVLLRHHRDDVGLRHRFIEEAQIGGQLQHPGIVPVYELGAFPDRRPFLAMKLVRGRTLAALLADRPDPAHELPRFLAIFEQVCQTVAYAHSRRVIHRDLKPSNVMVGSFGEVQVMDWGLAKVLPEGGVADERKRTRPDLEGEASEVHTIRSEGSGSESEAGSVMGTPAYMAPEQARGEVDRLDERADVFGLGAILCEILTGRPPHVEFSRGDVLDKARRGDTADALARLDACGADAELASLARDCLAARPSDRPRDAGEVARRVTAYTAGVQDRLRAAELARVKAQTKAEEERKRRRLAVGLAASLIGLVVAVGGGGAWWTYDQKARAARLDVALRGVEVLRDQAERAGDDLSHWSTAREAANQFALRLAEVRDESTRARAASLIESVGRGRDAAIADQLLLDEVVAIRGDAVEEPPDQTDARYGEAFHTRRIDPNSLPVEDAGRAIAGRFSRVALASALDAWANVRRSLGNRKGAEHLDLIAQRADPDPWRNRLRATAKERTPSRRREVLLQLARESADGMPAVSVGLLGSLLLESGEVAVAEQVLRPARLREPGDGWLNIYLARSLIRLGRPEESIRYFTAAQAVLPAAAFELAHALEAKGETDEAIRLFRDLARRAPENGLHLTCLGEALKSRGRAREAEAALDSAIALSRRWAARKPDSPQAHFELGVALRYKGDFDQAITEFRQAIRLGPHSFSSRVNLGNALYDKGQVGSAIAEFREAIRLMPGSAEAHCNLGNSLMAQKDFDGAIAEYHQAIRLGPNIANIHNSLGIALKSRDGDSAIAEYREAIRLKPDFALAHYNLGQFLWELKHEARAAEAEFREAIRLKPDYAKAHVALGVVLSTGGHLEGGIAEYREAIRLEPEHAEAHCNLGFALNLRGNPDGARTEYREAIRIEPEYADAHYKLGLVLRDQGKPEGAFAEFLEAIRLRPGFAPAHCELGLALCYQRKNDQAIAEFSEAIRLDPLNPTTHYNLGLTLGGQGMLEKAAAEYREAIRIEPEYADAHCNLGLMLGRLGDHGEAIIELRRGDALGSRRPDWRNPSATWVREAEQRAAMAGRLSKVLEGEEHPQDAAERVALAELCHETKRYASAARLWTEAFEAEPKLQVNRKAQHAYNAACAAALAGCGQGKDDPPLDEDARSRLRQQALDWLKGELAAWSSLMNRESASAKGVAQTLQHWNVDPDLAGVRDPAGLAKLPEDERARWRALWDDVGRLLGEAGPK